MADLDYNVTTFKNTTVKTVAGEVYNIDFINDTDGQVQYSAIKDDIIITIYQTRNGIPTSKPLSKLTLKNAKNTNGVNLKTFNYDYLNLFDQYFPATHKGNKYTGSSFNENVSSNENNETFTLGKGNDNIAYNFDEHETHGKDIINLAKDERLNIDFTDNGDMTYTYKKSGNDAVIEVRKDVNFIYNAKIVCSVSKTLLYGAWYTVNAKMYQVDGNTYEVSKKAYSIKFYTQDIQAMELKAGKTTTLYCELNDTVENVYEEFQELLRQQAMFNTGDYVEFSTTENPAQNTAAITLKNYFTLQDENGVSINGSADAFTQELQTVLNASYMPTEAEITGLKKRIIKDTFLDEEIDIGYGKGDTVSSLGGNDTITINAPQNPNIVSQNNITLKNGEKTLNFTGNFGNTKITMDSTATVDLSGIEGELIKNGNNLEIYQDYQNNNIDKVTINNYFKNYNNYNIAFDNAANLTNALINGDKRILYDYSDRKDKKLTASELSDHIIYGEKTQTANALNGNNIIEFSNNPSNWCEAFAGEGNDEYRIKSTNVSHDIEDKGGADSIFIECNHIAKEDVLFLFDVKKEGTKTAKYNDLTSLHAIYTGNYKYKFEGEGTAAVAKGLAQGKFYNLLNIHNYFDEQGQESTGCIETIGLSAQNTWAMDNLDTIRGQVINWLNNHNEYSSTMQVLYSGSENDIAGLLQIYEAIA